MRKYLNDVKKNDDGSFEYEGENWIIKTYHTPRFTVQVSKYIEMFTDIFNKAFVLKRDFEFKDVKPLFIVYPDESSYLKSGAILGSAGQFFSNWEGSSDNLKVTLVLKTYYKTRKKEPTFDDKAPLSIIQHEATHCLLQRIYGTKEIPNWLNEGAATYYEAWNIRLKISDSGNSKKDVAARKDRITHSWRVKRLEHYIKENNNELPRMDYLVSLVNYDDWNVDNMGPITGYHYMISESFFDFLMHRKSLRKFMLTLLERTLDGEEKIITDAELLEYEKEWLKFLEKFWGCKFSKSKIKARVQELSERKKAAEE